MIYFLFFIASISLWCTGHPPTNGQIYHDFLNYSDQKQHPQAAINQVREMLPLLPYQHRSHNIQELINQFPNLSKHKYTNRALQALDISDSADCQMIVHMSTNELEQMFRSDWPHFMKKLLHDSTINDDVIWTLFNHYATSKFQYWNQDDIVQYRKELEYVIEKRKKLREWQQSIESEKIQSKQKEVCQRFGCSTKYCNALIAQSVQSKTIQDHDVLPKILPHLIQHHANVHGLLPAFANDARATVLNFNNQTIPQKLQVPANYFFAVIQNRNTDQMATFIAQQGLESIAQTAQDNNPEKEIFANHAEQLYQLLLKRQSPQETISFEPNPMMLQEIQNLETLYQDFYDHDDPENILSLRYESIQTTIQSPNQTQQVPVPSDVAGFMYAHGIPQSIFVSYQQNAVQQQITYETICIIQQAIQAESVTPCIMIGRSIRLLHQAVGQVSQQTLLYNRLGKIANAFESADIGWCLVTYGPDMIAGTFDAVIAPMQLAGVFALGAGQAITHPLETLQMIANGCNTICDATQTIGKKLYRGAQATGHYFINHNPYDWYDDAGNLRRRSIDIVYDVKDQATDYIATVDSHQAVRAATSFGVGWFMMPVVQARAGASIAAFTQSIKEPLLEKTNALQIACAAILTKGKQQGKALSFAARNKIQQVIKATDELIGNLLPQPELAACTPCGDIINIGNNVGLIQKVKDQLFYFQKHANNEYSR